MKRVLFVTVLLLLASCSREIPLRIGPTSLIHDFAELEVRVWRSGQCPASASEAASPTRLEDVIVTRDYFGVASAPVVGSVPSGLHAVSALVRDTACNVAVYGCTPNVDFGTAQSVEIAWSPVSMPIGCSPGTCVAGRCQDGASDAGH